MHACMSVYMYIHMYLIVYKELQFFTSMEQSSFFRAGETSSSLSGPIGEFLNPLIRSPAKYEIWI